MVGTNGVNPGSVDANESLYSQAAADSKKTGKSSNYGKAVGTPKLSEEAAKYYEELKKKYSNMDFVLVSKDQKENAQANAASFANPSKMVVLIDEEKIERMANDENYRKQYESVIANAASNMGQLKSSLESSGANVAGFGMKVNDNGTASYFAVLKKSSQAQKERIEKKAEEKRAEKKEAAKKAERKEKEERLKGKKTDSDDDDEYVTISANSIEELMRKISDYSYEQRESLARTDQERAVGQSIDYFG